MDEVSLEAGSRHSDKLIPVMPTRHHGGKTRVLRNVSVLNLLTFFLLMHSILVRSLSHNARFQYQKQIEWLHVS